MLATTDSKLTNRVFSDHTPCQVYPWSWQKRTLFLSLRRGSERHHFNWNNWNDEFKWLYETELVSKEDENKLLLVLWIILIVIIVWWAQVNWSWNWNWNWNWNWLIDEITAEQQINAGYEIIWLKLKLNEKMMNQMMNIGMKTLLLILTRCFNNKWKKTERSIGKIRLALFCFYFTLLSYFTHTVVVDNDIDYICLFCLCVFLLNIHSIKRNNLKMQYIVIVWNI